MVISCWFRKKIQFDFHILQCKDLVNRNLYCRITWIPIKTLIWVAKIQPKYPLGWCNFSHWIRKLNQNSFNTIHQSLQGDSPSIINAFQTKIFPFCPSNFGPKRLTFLLHFSSSSHPSIFTSSSYSIFYTQSLLLICSNLESRQDSCALLDFNVMWLIRLLYIFYFYIVWWSYVLFQVINHGYSWFGLGI